VESKPEAVSKKSGGGHSGEEVTGPDDDEESMDWWTKYFASVDNLIEVGSFSALYFFHCEKKSK
jgi:hypothetical protein